MEVQAHGRDCNSIHIKDKSHSGYVPYGLGIGGGDDVEFAVCLNCGQMQGTWPLPETELERGDEE